MISNKNTQTKFLQVQTCIRVFIATTFDQGITKNSAYFTCRHTLFIIKCTDGATPNPRFNGFLFWLVYFACCKKIYIYIFTRQLVQGGLMLKPRGHGGRITYKYKNNSYNLSSNQIVTTIEFLMLQD